MYAFVKSPSWKRRNSETIRLARQREEILQSGALIPKRAFWQQYRRAKRHGYTGTAGAFLGKLSDEHWDRYRKEHPPV